MTAHAHWRQSWAQAVRRDTSLSMTARMVGQALALDFANDVTGLCNPGRRTLADHLGVSLDTIKRAVGELVRAGRLAVQPGKHRGATSSYSLTAAGEVVALRPRAAAAAPRKAAHARPASASKGGQRCTPSTGAGEGKKGGKFAQKGGQRCTPSK